jgi:hypothetical protein
MKRRKVLRELTDDQKERLHGIPALMRATFARAYTKGSKPAVIKAKCLDCCGYQRKEVGLCPAEACPVWPWRPFQRHAASTRATGAP